MINSQAMMKNQSSNEADNAVLIRPGHTRLFGAIDIKSEGLVAGWSEPESGHTWNDGYDAVADLELESESRKLKLVIEGIPFISDEVRKQDLTIFVNGIRVGFWRFSSPERVVVEAPLPWTTGLGKGLGENKLRLTFHLPDSVSPSELGKGDDIRRLGFCFYNITLRNAA